jgi:hypothetical protein
MAPARIRPQVLAGGFDARHDRLAFVLDLPSRGDTCFASALPGVRPDEVVIYDYSSDVHGPDLPWAAGQRRDTYVYRHVLRFSRQETAVRTEATGVGPL